MSGVPDIDEMFPSALDEESPSRVEELFRRAYFDGNGPFSRVCDRLRLGYSPLVYVPGNCMYAAAAVVKARLGNNRKWIDFLEHPGEGGLEQVWRATPGLVAMFHNWLTNGTGKPPAAIFHNLDFLTDGRGGVYNHLDAQTALAGLVAGARQGVVLGLSDRDEPELPNAITRAFSEMIRINEIPYENFHRLIPARLGEKLSDWGQLTEGAVWLMASRLRSIDPPRVHRILSQAYQGQTSLEDVFQRIVASTQTVNFLAADAVGAAGGRRPRGVAPEILDTLERNLIRPYRQWKAFAGDRDSYRRALQKLPPGAILFGPSGTGKTFLARWIASEIGLPVRAVSAAELRAGLYGESERNVAALFRDARHAAPCVLILDDADDLLPDREKVQGSVASADQAIVNVFLQQLDGFFGRLEGILIILTTNRFGSLDAAAKTRLPLHTRVPYPKTPAQVGEIVDEIAREYAYTLTPQVRDALAQRFFDAIGEIHGPRATADSGFFSPREIQQAMRMLDAWDGTAGGGYTPTMDDVDRMKQFYA